MTLLQPFTNPFTNTFVSPFESGCFELSSLFANGENGFIIHPWDLSTLFQDSAGTTPVTADNDPIGRVNDVSGNGNNYTQTTSGARPAFDLTSNIYSIDADGTNDYLEDGPFMYAANGASLIIPVKAPAQQSRYVYSEASATDNDPRYSLLTDFTNTDRANLRIRNDTGTFLLNQTGTITAFDDTWHILTLIDSGSNIKLYVDNVLDIDANYTRSGAVTLENSSFFGVILSGGVFSMLNGQIGGALLIDRVLTDEERNLATGAMALFVGLSNVAAFLGGQPVCNFPRE